MKKTMTKMMLTLMFLLFAGSAFAATLTVRADNWPPYNSEPTAKNPGYMIEVLKEIYEPQGIAIDYQLMPWTRACNDVNAGKYDAVVGTDKSENPGMIFPQESFGDMVSTMYVRNDNPWRYAGIDSLAGKRLGVIDGYSYSDELDPYIEKNKGGKVFAATGDDALPMLIKMLQAGRIDVLIEDANVMRFTLVGAGAKNIVSAGRVDTNSTALEFGLSNKSKTSADYARKFDEGIAKLRASGRLAEILNKYGVQDWK